MNSDIAEPIADRHAILASMEDVVREFFRTQFHEKPRLLTSSYVNGHIHVHGYRPVPPAEIRLLANPAMTDQLKKYHEQLFHTTQQSLKLLLSHATGKNVTAVECVFDPAQHEFDIVVIVDQAQNSQAHSVSSE
jgi:hypothetical protein